MIYFHPRISRCVRLQKDKIREGVGAAQILCLNFFFGPRIDVCPVSPPVKVLVNGLNTVSIHVKNFCHIGSSSKIRGDTNNPGNHHPKKHVDVGKLIMKRSLVFPLVSKIKLPNTCLGEKS